jgi:hypothetical protein
MNDGKFNTVSFHIVLLHVVDYFDYYLPLVFLKGVFCVIISYYHCDTLPSADA